MATYTDDFTGTAGTDLSGRTMSGGGTLTKLGGTNAGTISAANAVSVSAGSGAQRSAYLVPSGVGSTQYAKTVRSTSNVDAGPCICVADDGAGLRGYFIRANTTTVAVRRIAPTGTLTTIASIPNAGVSTDAIEVRRIDGTTLRAFRNGSQVGSDITDSTYTTGLPGIYVGSASAITSLMDDLDAGDLAGGATFQAAWARGSNIILGSGQ